MPQLVNKFTCCTPYNPIHTLKSLPMFFTKADFFILSSSFVIALMFKASYIGLWCAFGIIIIIKLLKDREWKKLSLYIFYILIFCLITFALSVICSFVFCIVKFNNLLHIFSFSSATDTFSEGNVALEGIKS